MKEHFINQILNNFKGVSKLYLELIEKKINNLTFYISNNKVRIKPPEDFYFEYDAEKTLILFSNTSDKITICIDKDEFEISRYDMLVLAGFIRNKTKPSKTLENSINSSIYHEALYLSLNQLVDPYKLFIIYSNLKLINELENIIKPEDEKSILIYAKLARVQGNIKKALNCLSMIRSKEYEIEKNLEYAWLHYLNKNYQNASKIFNYYANNLSDDKKIEALYGLSLSLLKLDENNIIKVKEILSKIKNLSPLKLNILHTLSDIYLDLRDYLKVYEISQEIIEIFPDIKTLNRKCISLFLNSDYDNANKLLYEIAVFDLKTATDIISKIPPENIKINPNESFYIKKSTSHDTIKENFEKKSILEAVLKPEDISSTKLKFSTFFPSEENTNSIEIEKDISELQKLAFDFAKSLEDEFQTKILFNYEGLDLVERKLRITFMSEIGIGEKNYIIKGASAFITFLIKERFKAEIINYTNFDPWTNEAIIKNKNSLQLITYPAARIWLLNWSDKLPQQGWLRNYLNYLSNFMNQKEENLYGKKAIISQQPSHPEKIFDATIEHKKILEVASEIEETSHIPLNPSSIIKIESEIKKKFKPQIPPTRDGWKILRCYAHIFLEIVLREIKPQWYNVEKNDGLWSFKIGEKTFIFPIGKLYKTALLRENLIEYYDTIVRVTKLRD